MIFHATKPSTPSCPTRRALLAGGFSLAGAAALPASARTMAEADIEAAAHALAAALQASRGGVWCVHIDLPVGLVAISKDFAKPEREGDAR